MSKIARYQGNVRAFASDARGMERTVFGGTNQADDLTSQITASFLRGWGIVGAAEHPSLEDFNAAMYAMSQFIAYQHQMGVPEWHAEQEYHIGSICTHNGESYQSLQNANVGSQPPSAKWTPVLTSENGLANLGLEETINLAKNAVPATRRVNNKPLSGDITLWAADVKAISADTVGEITDNGTMASANTPGWWRVAVSNPDTVADFPTWPDGSKLYGYGYLFVEKFGNTWFQHYYAHRGANAKRQDWGSVPNTSRPWIIDYNTENKPSAGEVGAVSAGGGDYNHTFRLGAVGTLGDESNPVQLISAAANQAADNFVAWTSYTWYQDYVRTGVVRAGDTTIKSFAVEINGVRFLEIGRDGTLLNGNMASDLRLGQEESISMSIPGYGQSVDCVVPSGCYVTGLTSTSTGSYIGTTKIFYRRLQRKVAGNWVDASWL